MREIKFRAWDKENNEMKIVTELDFLYLGKQNNHHEYQGKKSDIWLNNEDTSYMPIEIVLMQFAGLKDKNGKEIYEGDIVDQSYINPMTNNKVVQHYVVEWENGVHRMNFINAPHEAYDRYLWMLAKNVEIIGNVYENPDLLEV